MTSITPESDTSYRYSVRLNRASPRAGPPSRCHALLSFAFFNSNQLNREQPLRQNKQLLRTQLLEIWRPRAAKTSCSRLTMAGDEMSPNDDYGPMLLAVVYPLFMLAVIVYIIRMCARPSKKFALTAADYTITIALVRFSLSSGFFRRGARWDWVS